MSLIPYPIWDIRTMSRKRTLDKKEWVNRYAESALISAIRLRRYWISQGDSEDVAVEKAVKQAVGMMAASGLPPEKLLELFRELERACKAFIEMLEEICQG